MAEPEDGLIDDHFALPGMDAPLLYEGDDAPHFDEGKHKYTHPETGDKLASATEILGILDKPALPWWGMTIGVQAVLTLVERHGVDVLDLSYEQVMGLVVEEKLTVNHMKEKGAKKGREAHDSLESWGRDGTAITLAGIGEDARPRVQAAARFVVEHKPEVVGVEVMVWDYHRGTSGTFDLLAWIKGELWLLDYKTSKRVYTSHALQLAGYEGMRQVLGLRPVDHMGVVLLNEDGTYELEEQHARPVEFWAVYRAWRALQDVKQRQANARRARTRALSTTKDKG